MPLMLCCAIVGMLASQRQWMQVAVCSSDNVRERRDVWRDALSMGSAFKAPDGTLREDAW